MTTADRLDACPECMCRDNVPTRVEPIPNGVECHYVCASCGGQWVTSWWGDA